MTAYLGRAGPRLFAHVEMFPSKTQRLWGRAIRPCQFAPRTRFAAHLHALSRTAPARQARQPIQRIENHYDLPQPPKMSLRPLAFAVAVCVGSYCGAAVLTRRSDQKFIEVSKEKPGRSSMGGKALREWVEWKETQQTLAWMRMNHVPDIIQGSYSRFKYWWNQKGDGTRATWILIGINTIPFLAWRLPGAQNFMRRNFTHTPLSGRSFTMLTAAFSHRVGPIRVKF